MDSFCLRCKDSFRFEMGKPSPTFEGICAELRSAIGTAMRSREAKSTFTTQLDVDDDKYEYGQHWTDRTYGGENRAGWPCDCRYRSRVAYPHWPATTHKEAFDQFYILTQKHNCHHRYLAHQWWISVTQLSTLATEAAQFGEEQAKLADDIRAFCPSINVELEDSCDLAGKTFLELLDWLRDILLQDAAVLQHRFPLFPLWRHPIFSHPAWRSFADDVLVAHNTAEEPMNMRIRNVLPQKSDGSDLTSISQ